MQAEGPVEQQHDWNVPADEPVAEQASRERRRRGPVTTKPRRTRIAKPDDQG